MEWVTNQAGQQLGADGPILNSEEIANIIQAIEVVDPTGIQQVISQPATRNAQKSSARPAISKDMSPQPSAGDRRRAEVRIVEQPASKALRFRYECEGRSAGSIPGVNSTPENKTFPTIQIVGFQGTAVVVVSCVTKDEPYRPHPHNLVGKEGCSKGVCTIKFNNDDMTVSFSNLGIQCVKKKDIEEHLKIREGIRVDPFRTGFDHKSNPSSIDLNVVRLCFQVFLEGDPGKFTRPLKPVVSEPIFDKKAMSDLTICKLSDCTSPSIGGREIILLCEKVAKEDIAVRFYEERNGELLWQAQGDFQHSSVHKQVAIAFKTPPYDSTQITEPVRVKIQLLRPSDGATSDPLPFDYTPVDPESDLKRKRQRVATAEIFAPIIAQNPSDDRANLGFQSLSPNLASSIKAEPRDQTPSPFAPTLYGGSIAFEYRNTQATPSPQPPHLLHPFSVSPQPYQMGGNMLPPLGLGPSPQFSNPSPFGNMVGGNFSQNPDTSFPLANCMPPLLNNNIVTPVPVLPTVLDSTTEATSNIPAHLPNFSHSDLNMSIDPMDNFQMNSSEVRRILQNNDLSFTLSAEQSRADNVDERVLSDSLSRLLNN